MNLKQYERPSANADAAEMLYAIFDYCVNIFLNLFFSHLPYSFWFLLHCTSWELRVNSLEFSF